MGKPLKNILKALKLSEATISTLLGAVVVIIVGLLIFNYFKQASKQEITPEAAQEESEIVFEEEEGKMVPASLPVKHKVAAGESLWKIAEKYYTSGYNWVDIAQENKLYNPDIIFVDQELNVPKVAVRKPLVTEAAPPKDKITEEKYIVKSGDNLWSIAVRAYADGYKWSEIAKANKLSNPDHIEVGQELMLAR